jgi:hypothetical protein
MVLRKVFIFFLREGPGEYGEVDRAFVDDREGI